MTSEKVVSKVISSVEVEHQVNNNAIPINDNADFKRLFMELSLIILLYYSLFNKHFQIIFIVLKIPSEIRFAHDND